MLPHAGLSHRQDSATGNRLCLALRGLAVVPDLYATPLLTSPPIPFTHPHTVGHDSTHTHKSPGTTYARDANQATERVGQSSDRRPATSAHAYGCGATSDEGDYHCNG